MVADRNNFEHGFLYTGGSYLTLDVPGAIDTVANGINDAGQFVGWYRDATREHAFLATPTPEPSAVVLSIIGAFSLIGYLWWSRGRRFAGRTVNKPVRMPEATVFSSVVQAFY